MENSNKLAAKVLREIGSYLSEVDKFPDMQSEASLSRVRLWLTYFDSTVTITIEDNQVSYHCEDNNIKTGSYDSVGETLDWLLGKKGDEPPL